MHNAIDSYFTNKGFRRVPIDNRLGICWEKKASFNVLGRDFGFTIHAFPEDAHFHLHLRLHGGRMAPDLLVEGKITVCYCSSEDMLREISHRLDELAQARGRELGKIIRQAIDS